MNSNLPKIPYSVIYAAKQGNDDALKYVLKIFTPYIRTISARPHYDALGKFTESADEDMEAYLQYRLVMGILNNFEILPLGNNAII